MPNVMQIFNIGNISVNVYLLKSSTHSLLIDSGFPNTINDLGRNIRQAGIQLKEIDWLMVTHFHPDHAGAVQELKNEGVKFLVVDLQVPFIDKMEEMMIEKWRYRSLDRSDNAVISIGESRAFLKTLNIRGEFIFTPGHSDDSVSVFLDAGEVFTGDLTAKFLTDFDRVAIESWKRIQDLGGKIVYPGHGAPYKLL
jgi:glyoxylase-like metal-dependent hydrolase (beta-lactamase superfamily II)